MKNKITKKEKSKIVSWLLFAVAAFLIIKPLSEEIAFSPGISIFVGILLMLGGAWYFDLA